MQIIYIASPYTIGNQEDNVKVQMAAGHRILDMGHCPIAPLLSHYLHLYRHRPYDEWMAMDKKLISTADILLRLPGESKGADIEIEHARMLEIPVILGWNNLNHYLMELK